MEKTVSEIAEVIGAEIDGNPDLTITGIHGLEEAGSGDLSFLSHQKYLSNLEKSRAAAFIIPQDISVDGKTLLKVANPSLALAKVLQFLFPNPIPHPKGIHPTAILGEGVQLGEEVAIGPYSVIGDSCRIGDKSIIYGGVHVGPQSTIGNNTILYSNVTIRERIQIGHRVILHPGVVVGADGFGFVATEEGHLKIPQVGRVVIEDDVEIGANVCIDRSTLDTTVIGRGTKIDNLVQIGHNVKLGEACIVAGQAGIAGSARLGKMVMIGGQAGVKDHVKLSDGTKVAAMSGVAGNIREGGEHLGTPARPRDEFLEQYFLQTKLPQLYKEVEEIKKQLKSS